MRIHIVNPNTTASMTGKIGAAGRAAASAGTSVTAANPEFGPVSIEGYFDEVFSIPGLIAEIGKAPEADAFVIACFDDTGLDAARCATQAPVIEAVRVPPSAWRATAAAPSCSAAPAWPIWPPRSPATMISRSSTAWLAP